MPGSKLTLTQVDGAWMTVLVGQVLTGLSLCYPGDRSHCPTVHTPRKKRAEPNIESDKEAVASPGHVRKTGLKTESEEPITTAPQRLPDSPFPKRLSPIPYQRPGTPYRKVDLPGRETGILDTTDDSFEIDSESERTLTEEPKETQKPTISEMPESITKRKLAPVILPFGADPEKGPKAPEKPHVRPAPAVPILPHGAAAKEPIIVPVVRSPSKHPLSTPFSSPSSPISPLLAPVAMGTVEEIKNALIELNRVAAMPIPQFYGKKGEKPEDHIMKVDDYFQNYITDQEQKCNRFRDTCCGKAMTWLSTLTEYPKVFDPEAAPDEAM